VNKRNKGMMLLLIKLLSQ